MVHIPQKPATRGAPRPHFTRRQALGSLGVAGLAALWSRHGLRSAQAAAPPYRPYVITANDDQFQLAPSTPGGYTAVTLNNSGAEPHHAMFMRLNPGATVAEFMAAAKGPDPGALFALATSAGGPGSVDSGQISHAIVDLAPGQYVVICMVPDAKGMPHYQMGMVAPLTVTAAAEPGAAPAAQTTIDLVDFSFDGLPPAVRPGRHVWKVVNTGAQLHEMVLNRLAPGHTFQQVAAMLTAPQPAGAPAAPPPGPPPFTGVAGVAPMSQGAANWAVLNLTPGDYFAICYIPDIKSGKPHFDLGMMKPFSVAAGA